MKPTESNKVPRKRRDKSSAIMGRCVDCLGVILKLDNWNPEHPDIYECRHCGHPHTREEIVDYESEK